jgi:MFS family permease
VLVVRVSDRVGKGIRSSPRDALVADSTAVEHRGRAYGFHRAMDHLGAVIGPLVAFALINGGGLELRTVFWLAAIPALLSVFVLAVFVRESARPVDHAATAARLVAWRALSAPMRRYLVILFIFTLGTASDAFLLLRASDLGVGVAMVPVLWAVHHVVKSALATPAGALSDRVGRRPLIVAGWLLFAATYAGFAVASDAWHIWTLFIAYGAFYALTEGPEKAFVADLAGRELRGTAFGWFNLALATAALPASVVFGLVWTHASPSVAFALSATLALAASAAMFVWRVGGPETAGPARS